MTRIVHAEPKQAATESTTPEGSQSCSQTSMNNLSMRRGYLSTRIIHGATRAQVAPLSELLAALYVGADLNLT